MATVKVCDACGDPLAGDLSDVTVRVDGGRIGLFDYHAKCLPNEIDIILSNQEKENDN